MNKFKFFFPVDISKAKDKDGNEIMRLGGIASTMDKDSDGEFLDPTGFDITEFKKTGLVNWHHQTKNSPAAIIGEPYKAEIRKDGFYVETDLYADSPLAREVFETAQILAKNSKTRKLGYSIEGTVLEKDENNPKIIKRAIITGLAITHMPKNAQTFADIIKGKGVEIEKEEDEEEEEKSIDTESASALKRESVGDSKYSIKEVNANERYDKIFETYPGISIEKADKINFLLTKIHEKMLGKKVTDSDIEKAMTSLGLDMEENPFISKAKKDDKVKPFNADMSDEEIAENVTKKEFGSNEEEDEESDEVEGEDKKPDAKKKIQKSKEVVEFKPRTNSLIKAIEDSAFKQSENSKALAVLIKSNIDSSELMKSRIEAQDKKIEAMTESLVINKEMLYKALETIKSFGAEPSPRKSITKSFQERNFGSEQNIQKGESGVVLSKSKNPGAILQVIDQCSFEKGYDAEFGDAVTSFEATKQLSANVIHRLKLEKQITIVD